MVLIHGFLRDIEIVLGNFCSLNIKICQIGKWKNNLLLDTGNESCW